MASPWLIPAAMSVFGAIQGYGAGEDMERQSREQEKLAEKNALLARRELAEQSRRQAEEDYRIRSAALARAAASGVRIEGSVADYLDYMGDEQARQLQWLRTAGASRIRLQLESDKSQAEALKIRANTQKWGSLIQGFTSAFSYMDKGGMFTEPTKITSSSTGQTGYLQKSGVITYPVN